MTYWVKVNGVTVSYHVDSPEETTYYNDKTRAWHTASPELIAQALEYLKQKGMVCTECGGIIGYGEHNHTAEVNPPKPKRKELMRRLEELEKDRDYWKRSYNQVFDYNQQMQRRAEFCTHCEFATHDKTLFEKHLLEAHQIMRFNGNISIPPLNK